MMATGGRVSTQVMVLLSRTGLFFGFARVRVEVDERKYDMHHHPHTHPAHAASPRTSPRTPNPAYIQVMEFAVRMIATRTHHPHTHLHASHHAPTRPTPTPPPPPTYTRTWCCSLEFARKYAYHPASPLARDHTSITHSHISRTDLHSIHLRHASTYQHNHQILIVFF